MFEHFERRRRDFDGLPPSAHLRIVQARSKNAIPPLLDDTDGDSASKHWPWGRRLCQVSKFGGHTMLGQILGGLTDCGGNVTRWGIESSLLVLSAPSLPPLPSLTSPVQARVAAAVGEAGNEGWLWEIGGGGGVKGRVGQSRRCARWSPASARLEFTTPGGTHTSSNELSAATATGKWNGMTSESDCSWSGIGVRPRREERGEAGEAGADGTPKGPKE